MKGLVQEYQEQIAELENTSKQSIANRDSKIQKLEALIATLRAEIETLKKQLAAAAAATALDVGPARAAPSADAAHAAAAALRKQHKLHIHKLENLVDYEAE